MPFRPIENVFELHRGAGGRLLVVFSAANAGSFTFFKATRQMRPDRLHIRDPFGTAWYQNGLADGETLADIETRIAEVARDYREIWMLGSSMGGYAALYFGARLGARRVLAIAPQLIVDPRFARGPGRGVTVHTPDISGLVRAATRTRFTILFGSFDLIDAYNIAQLYKDDPAPDHCRVLQYANEDHMLPVRIDRAVGLRRYFSAILSRDEVPDIGIPCTTGPPLSAERLAVLQGYIAPCLERDHKSAHAHLAAALQDNPDWTALEYLMLDSGFHGRPDLHRALLPRAQALSDTYPEAIDFAFLAARLAEQTGDARAARAALRRVFAVRSGHRAATQLLARLEAQETTG
ncbi:YqiA/YcfP family alpha/beta fold hydrolase [Pseudoruegeria sp. HB172150]|uniref:YqiA/YcfP family alpha/beta fold hydrolase n=1 Tax=Pseudoruegeria sp. HB172150 TaxID=2721164 RepID=UPI0015526FD3